jgi:fructose-1,6-bisphosphatase I
MLQVPDKGMIYSFNEGNYNGWSEGLRKYMDSLKDPSKWGGKPYTSRSNSPHFYRLMLLYC